MHSECNVTLVIRLWFYKDILILATNKGPTISLLRRGYVFFHLTPLGQFLFLTGIKNQIIYGVDEIPLIFLLIIQNFLVENCRVRLLFRGHLSYQHILFYSFQKLWWSFSKDKLATVFSVTFTIDNPQKG